MEEKTKELEEYHGYCPFCNDGDIEEIDREIIMGESITFFMKCLDCKKKFKVTSKSYYEEVK